MGDAPIEFEDLWKDENELLATWNVEGRRE